MPRKPPVQQEPTLIHLVIPKHEAQDRLRAQIEKGCEIRSRHYGTSDDLSVGREDKDKWIKYTAELLRRIFSNDQYASAFVYAGPSFRGGVIGGKSSLSQRIEGFTKDLNYKIKELESILERLDLIPEQEADLQSKKPQEMDRPTAQTRKVFVVHGHDEEAKLSVARLLEKLQLNPIILHEQPNQGRTVIEKFEAYSDVGFAVILFTPDDVGASKGEEEKLRPRARQNVVFELGYFIGRMGRGRVCVLHKGSVEILSDYQGVLYVPMDQRGAWKMELGRELEHAGIEIDLNKVL